MFLVCDKITYLRRFHCFWAQLTPGEGKVADSISKKIRNIGVTIPGNWSFEIQRISREIRWISWNPADFMWNPADFTKSGRFHVKCSRFHVKSGRFHDNPPKNLYKSNNSTKTLQFYGVHGEGYVSWLSREICRISRNSARFHEYELLVWSPSIGLSFERPTNVRNSVGLSQVFERVTNWQRYKRLF